MDDADRVRASRLRRTVERQGLLLARSRRRDPAGLGDGTDQGVDAETNMIASADHIIQQWFRPDPDEIE